MRLRHSSRASPARRTTWKGSMTALAPGSSSAAALLNPVNPSIATISMRSRHMSGWEASQVLKTRLERPGTMSKRREGPLRSRMGVKSKMTVTYVSPYGVCRHTCSSTPMTRTPSNRPGSLISRRWPSVRTAVLAVFQDTPRAWATRATVRWWTTRPVSAQRTAARESLARGSAAWLISWRHT